MSTTPGDEAGREAHPSSAVRRAMVRFVSVAAVGLLFVGLGSLMVARSISREVAVRDAIAHGGTFARAVSGPLVSQGLREGDPVSIAVFTEVMENRLEESSMVHIKVWDPDGTVVWSDDEDVRGQRFELERVVEKLFVSGGVVGGISPIDKPLATSEEADQEFLEVYAAARSNTGTPVVVESYWSTEQIDEAAGAVMWRVAPLAVGALLLFAVVVFPLAWSLASRVDRIQSENNHLLKHALEASDLERRRIARDLHDGVMQDVSGAGYALSAIATTLPEEAQHPRRLLEEVGVVIRRVGDSLRSTLADIYPANLASQGLAPAVEELAARAMETGVDVQFDVLDMSGASLEVVQLSYRVIREGLRNVVRHAEATHSYVLATCVADTVYVSVEDDGRGPGEPPAGARATDEGHLGLVLLGDTMRDVGGALRVTPRADGGTKLAASFPLALGRN